LECDGQSGKVALHKEAQRIWLWHSGRNQIRYTTPK